MWRLLWVYTALLATLVQTGRGAVVGRLPVDAGIDEDLVLPAAVSGDDSDDVDGDEADRPRRIVPKSLFVAPGRHSLSCSSGATTSGRDRCVKLVWVDRTVHLHFLVNRLNGQFGDGEISPSKVSDEIDRAQRSPLRVALGIATESSVTTDGAVDEVTK